MAKNTGKEFEKLIKNIFESLLKLDGVKILEASHDVKLIGLSGAEHQIDAYLRFEFLGQERETVIEAKDFQKPVDKPRFMTFVGVLQDLRRRPNGVFVTRSGFSEGNIRPLAEANNIGLYVLEDLEGPTNSFTANLFENKAQIVQIAVEKDVDSSAIPTDSLLSKEVFLYGKNGELKTNLQELTDQAWERMVANDIPIGEFITFKSEEELYFESKDSQPAARCFGIIFQRMRSCVASQNVNFQMTHLLRLLTSDKRVYVDKSGTVHKEGDLVSIPIKFEKVGPDGTDVHIQVITSPSLQRPAADTKAF